jgi:hypothetical protein
VRCGRDDRTITAWFARWGFASLVTFAAGVAVLVGVMVAIPANVPGVTLQAVPVYRLEVGGAIFVGLYFASTAFVLALRNRAFIEFGSGAMKAGNLGDLPDTLLSQERAMEVLSGIVYDMRDSRDDREDE